MFMAWALTIWLEYPEEFLGQMELYYSSPKMGRMELYHLIEISVLI